ncbi:MAG: PEP-CTERM sorting domain-containing protein [Planctomycetota bacterium]|nr:MAG: PEP-CTERM sorting domain-containing protein [Planctomycetota bacterium]
MSFRKRFAMTLCLVGTASASLFWGTAAFGHSGRRLEIQVIDNQLFAQGYLSTGVPDDGGGSPRPYYNALHDHWQNITSSVAIADLPGYDVYTPGPLTGFDLSLELLGASKWVGPPMMPPGGTIPNLVPLDPGEVITIEHNSVSIDTDGLGSLAIASGIPGGGLTDIDLLYAIDDNPAGVLHVLEWQLSTNAPGVAPSASIYTILSPDGANPMEKLHHASLYLEQHLGLVPEPASASLMLTGLALLGAGCWWRRQRSAC